MDELTMAHEYVMNYLGNPACEDTTVGNIVSVAWSYVDKMQAEADKRKVSGLPEGLKQTFINGVEQPRYAKQVDWNLAPDWARYFAIRNDVSLWCVNKPTTTMDCIMSNGSCSPAPTFSFTGTHIVERPK